MSEMKNFGKEHQKFLHKMVTKEAKAAAAALKEGKPASLTREALEKFDFSLYYSDLMAKAPLLTTTMAAASTKNNFCDIKVTVKAYLGSSLPLRDLD